MTTEAAGQGPAFSEGLGPNATLVACPLCGADKGYTLSEGSTFRWWRVACADCGGELGECRSDSRTIFGGILPDRSASADEAWNEAGAYAQRLRAALTALCHAVEHGESALNPWKAAMEALGPNVPVEPTRRPR